MQKTTSYNEKMACRNVSEAAASAVGVPTKEGSISLGEIALISLVSGAIATTLGLAADMAMIWLRAPSKPKAEKKAPAPAADAA